MDTQKIHLEVSRKTANSIKDVALSSAVREVSSLTLPEIEQAASLIGDLVPAGNVPGIVLSGLARLGRRTPPVETVRRDVNVLFKGVQKRLNKVVYGAVFAGPAGVIWAYQKMLKIAGKDPADAFPDGTWQFYVEYALREDTARHANETHGFDSTLKQHQIQLNDIDRFTAWTMTAINCLHQYKNLIKNEWRERIYTRLLRQVTQDSAEAKHYADLYRAWEAKRPYGRGADAAPNQTYPIYRQVKFDQFLEDALKSLPNQYRQEWANLAGVAKTDSLPMYQKQMSILAHLTPGPYGEQRIPFPLNEAHVGLIFRGRYYLIPVCVPNGNTPPPVTQVRSQIAAIIQGKPTIPATSLIPLAIAQRSALANLDESLDETSRRSLETLRKTPILINCDYCDADMSLVEIRRQAERGIGDHALTIFHTKKTVIFDQSHIFFDGAWGAALAEIMSNEAISWGAYLNTLPSVEAASTPPVPLNFPFQPHKLTLPYLKAEVGAENSNVNVKAILSLRKLFKRRSDLLQLTVNDILVLYRAIHTFTYRPKQELEFELQKLGSIGETEREAVLAALDAIDWQKQDNPAILIPVDASQHEPRDRLYPMCFEVPLKELDLLTLHRSVVQALETYEKAGANRTQAHAEFNRLQKEYLANLAGFGAVLSKAKEIANAGESASVGTIKLLAHMPKPLQQLLDQVPGQFDFLNDIIKGREIFSNVGAVAPSSSLTRFITAKDDNEKKTLAWGVITDAKRVMRLSLRDFRPHVDMLVKLGYKEVATHITQDYLDNYAEGLNKYIQELHRITATSRETRLGAEKEI